RPADELPVLNPPEVPHCFVCGPANPEGLGLVVRRDGTDAVAVFTPRPAYQGYPGRLHGGIVGMLVDEMLVYAGAPHGLWGMTAQSRHGVRRPVPLGRPLDLRGRVVQRGHRGFRAVVTVSDGDQVVAEGEGMCVLLPRLPESPDQGA